MNTDTTATPVSTLSGASVKTMEGNDVMNIGGNVVKVEQKLQNVNVIVNRSSCTDAGDIFGVRENVISDSNAATNVFAILATLLGGIFGINHALTRESETDDISSENALLQESAPNCDATDNSEPRATVTEILPMDAIASTSSSVLDAFDSTISPLTRSSLSERYTRSMLECNAGYPLYEPDPESQYWEEGVRVGDVGLVTEDGGFDFLFNVCPTPDSSTNPDDLPDDFEMLRSAEILIKRHFQRDTHLFSNKVERTEEPHVKYACLGHEGGILELPLGASRFEAKNKFSFKGLAARHAENWYRYTILTRGRDAPNGSLYIVTSCIKCTDWGIVVFDRPSGPHDYLRFMTDEDNQNTQSKYRWNGSGAYIAKVAPDEGSPGSDSDADGPNQCVFLRGYKIMLRKDIWDDIVNSEFTGTSYMTVSSYGPYSKDKSIPHSNSSNQGGPSQRGTNASCGSTSRTTQNTCKDGRMDTDPLARVILYEHSRASPTHPSDLINAVLLCEVNFEFATYRAMVNTCCQKPNAKVALTHDDDWCDLLRENPRIPDSDALSKVALSYIPKVDEYGSVSLKRSDSNPIVDVTVGDSSCRASVLTSENRPPIDGTQTSSMSPIIPTHYSIYDGLGLNQQGHWHPFSSNVERGMNWGFARQAVGISADATGLLYDCSRTATAGSDANYAFALEDAGVGANTGRAESASASQGRQFDVTTLTLHPHSSLGPPSSGPFRHGGPESLAAIRPTYTEIPASIQPNPRGYPCICGKKFVDTGSLHRHQRNVCPRLRLLTDTKLPSNMGKNPTRKLPNKSDNSWHSLDATPSSSQFSHSSPLSQSSLQPISHITPIDINFPLANEDGFRGDIAGLPPFVSSSTSIGGSDDNHAPAHEDVGVGADTLGLLSCDFSIKATVGSDLDPETIGSFER